MTQNVGLYLIRGLAADSLHLIRFWRNFGAIPEWALTAPIFTSARMCNEALARTPSQGTTHHTMILLDRLVCRTYWEQALKRRSVKIQRSLPACRQHHDRRAALRIIG